MRNACHIRLHFQLNIQFFYQPESMRLTQFNLHEENTVCNGSFQCSSAIYYSFILKISSCKTLAPILSKAPHKLRNSLLTLETSSASEYNETNTHKTFPHKDYAIPVRENVLF